VFLKPRPLSYYLDALTAAGLTVTDVREKTIVADVEEWFELMTAYHDTVLGWVGGTKKLDGQPATPAALEDRMTIMRARWRRSSPVGQSSTPAGPTSRARGRPRTDTRRAVWVR